MLLFEEIVAEGLLVFQLFVVVVLAIVLTQDVVLQLHDFLTYRGHVLGVISFELFLVRFICVSEEEGGAFFPFCFELLVGFFDELVVVEASILFELLEDFEFSEEGGEVEDDAAKAGDFVDDTVDVANGLD